MGHADAANAPRIVAWVKGVPGAAQINLHRASKIHRGIDGWDADVAEITGAVPGWNIQTSAKCDREVCEVPADTLALAVGLPRRFCRSGVGVAKGHVLIDEVTNCLDSAPARGEVPEKAPGLC